MQAEQADLAPLAAALAGHYVCEQVEDAHNSHTATASLPHHHATNKAWYTKTQLEWNSTWPMKESSGQTQLGQHGQTWPIEARDTGNISSCFFKADEDGLPLHVINIQ